MPRQVLLQFCPEVILHAERDKHLSRTAHLLWSLFLFLYPMLVLLGRCIEAHESTQCDSRPVTIPLSGSAVAHQKEPRFLVLTIHSFVFHLSYTQSYIQIMARIILILAFALLAFTSMIAASPLRLVRVFPPLSLPLLTITLGQASTRSLAWQSICKGLFCLPQES